MHSVNPPPLEHQTYSQFAGFSPSGSSDLLSADLATTRWLDLLASDASEADRSFLLGTGPPVPPDQTNQGIETGFLYNKRFSATSPGGRLPVDSLLSGTNGSHRSARQPGHSAASPSVSTDGGLSVGAEAISTATERQAWQESKDIVLADHEAGLFRRFVNKEALGVGIFVVNSCCQHHFGS
jgi:hypothetical protein